MPVWLARTVLALLTYGGICWTVFSRLNPAWGEAWTTSWLLRYAQRGSGAIPGCDQVATLLVLMLTMILIDALPGVSHWFIATFVVAGYCLGHALWSF